MDDFVCRRGDAKGRREDDIFQIKKFHFVQMARRELGYLFFVLDYDALACNSETRLFCVS